MEWIGIFAHPGCQWQGEAYWDSSSLKPSGSILMAIEISQTHTDVWLFGHQVRNGPAYTINIIQPLCFQTGTWILGCYCSSSYINMHIFNLWHSSRGGFPISDRHASAGTAEAGPMTRLSGPMTSEEVGLFDWTLQRWDVAQRFEIFGRSRTLWSQCKSLYSFWTKGVGPNNFGKMQVGLKCSNLI